MIPNLNWSDLPIATAFMLVVVLLLVAFFRFMKGMDERSSRQNELLNTIITNHLSHLDTTLGNLGGAITCLREHCAGIWGKKEAKDGEP
jgi:hypothetical protein